MHFLLNPTGQADPQDCRIFPRRSDHDEHRNCRTTVRRRSLWSDRAAPKRASCFAAFIDFLTAPAAMGLALARVAMVAFLLAAGQAAEGSCGIAPEDRRQQPQGRSKESLRYQKASATCS